MYSFSYLEPVCSSTSSSNCCFLTCIQISQEAGQVFWYAHLLKNFPQFIVIHTVKGFGIVCKAEVLLVFKAEVFFWYSLAFSMIQWMLAIWSLVLLPFINPVKPLQILKDDAEKLLHSICQQIWKTQQWPQDWKESVFIPISKKHNAKKCSNYHPTALISHATKVMLKILRARL